MLELLFTELAGLLALSDLDGAAALLLLCAELEGRCAWEEDLVLALDDCLL